MGFQGFKTLNFKAARPLPRGYFVQLHPPPTFYLTAKEVRNSALSDDETRFEDENDITTDTDNKSEADFDSLDDDEFDPILGGDYNAADDNMEVD